MIFQVDSLVALIIFNPLGRLHNLNHVQRSEVFITKVQAFSISLLLRPEIPDVGAKKSALKIVNSGLKTFNFVLNIYYLWNVMDGSKAPATISCLEHLKAKFKRILNHSVQARLGAFALGVALVNPSQDGFLEPPELVAGLGPDLTPELPSGGLELALINFLVMRFISNFDTSFYS